MSQKSSKPILYIFTNNHFDPTWRRCWERRFESNGKSFVSYSEIEEYYILDNLELARKNPEYAFEAESTIVARKFLERNPERKEELRKLVEEGRFGVTGAGDNIIDGNMVLGESLVRNFMTGYLWVEDNLGQKTKLGVRNDGFGNSAQTPQIFRGCEVPWVTGFSYTGVKGKYWRGLDGSAICCVSIPGVGYGGDCYKYPPCEKCGGTGCRACNGRGIPKDHLAPLPRGIDTKKLEEKGIGLVMMSSEEVLPNPEIIRWAKQFTKKYEVRFALQQDVDVHLRDLLEKVDNPPKNEVHDSVELNPNNSGCWLTRIKTKQNCRRQEYAILGTETLSVMAALKAGNPYPRGPILQVWQRLFFTMFHDAVTATHVDPAYREIQDIWEEIDRNTERIRDKALSAIAKGKRAAISVVNPFGQPATEIVTARVKAGSPHIEILDDSGKKASVVSSRKLGGGECEVSFLAEGMEPLSARTFTFAPSKTDPNAVKELKAPKIENRRFRVEADNHGILSVYDKKLKTEILKADEYRVGELIMEHDEGSPWATLHPDQTRTPLACDTRLVAAEKGASFQRLVFEMRSSKRYGFSSFPPIVKTTVTLVDGLDQVRFETHVEWNVFNHRLRVAMPVPKKGKHIYGIPYGVLERKPYKPWFDWAAANGDWPTINWAGVQAREASVALLSKGLPSYRMEDGKTRGTVMLLSLLRSPAVPTYLHEPQYYTMTDYDGMRDAGSHDFEYAIAAYKTAFSESNVVPDAEAYNAALVAVPGQVALPDLPRPTSKNVRLSALKYAEKGKALILRLVEYRGRKGEVTISIPENVKKVTRVNLMERQDEPLEVSEGKVTLSVRPWEIATVRMGM